MVIGLSSCSKRLDRQLFEAYKNAGIGAMELSVGNKSACDTFDVNDILPLAEEYGIDLWSYHLPFGPFEEIDISQPETADFTVEYYKSLMAKIRAAGTRIFVIHPSGEPISFEDRPTRMATAKESLRKLAEYGDSIDAMIAVEDLPRTCLGNCSAEILELISVHDSLRVCFDTNHLLGEDNIDFINNIGRKIVTTHVSDYDFADEKHWLPGEGDVDWKALYSALSKVYDGPWLYELGFKAPATLSRPRKLTCEDFSRNAIEIFEGKGITPISRPKATIVISVDDGCSDTARLAVELEKRGLPATFNIVTAWVDGSVETKSPHVTVEELKQIYAGGLHEIAGHGDTHKNDNVDVIRGNDKLMEWCGMKEIGFASPGSGMTAEYIRANEEKYKAMDIVYIRTGSYPTPDERYGALTEKAKKDGRSEYVIQNIPYTLFELDTMAVPSVVVVNQTPVSCIKALADFTADEGLCTVFMFHAVRKEGEKNCESTWSYDFDKFCDFADHLCSLRDLGIVEVLTNMNAIKKYAK